MQLGTQTIGVWRTGPATEDQYHNKIPGKSKRTHEIPGCSVQPVVGGEYTTARSSTRTDYTIWTPIDSDLLDTDKIEYPSGSGALFSIVGAVLRWEVGSPLDHLVLNVVKVTG